MIKTLLATTTALTMLAATPGTADIIGMDDAERAAFRAEVRAYLMENPEVILEAVNGLEQRQQAQQAENDLALVAANAEDIFNDGYSWVGGNPDGDITLVEFIDYRCGYCRKAHTEVKELLASDGNIKFIVKEFPILGPDSDASSRFAIAVKQVAGDEAYGMVHDTLINFKGEASETALRRLSDTMGLDTDAVMAQMGSDAVSTEIAETRALAQRLQISGTPTFVLKDDMLRGYLPLDAMRQVIAEARS